jgi:hypothetical protein
MEGYGLIFNIDVIKFGGEGSMEANPLTNYFYRVAPKFCYGSMDLR